MAEREFDNVQINVEFETAEELRNLSSGESLNSALGKVDRAITEIKELQGSQVIAEYTVPVVLPTGTNYARRLFTVKSGTSCNVSFLFYFTAYNNKKEQVGVLYIGQATYKETIPRQPDGLRWLISGSFDVESDLTKMRQTIKARYIDGYVEVWADAPVGSNTPRIVSYVLLADPKNHEGNSNGFITFDNETLGREVEDLTLYPIEQAVIDGLGGTFEEVREEIASLKAVSGKQTSSTTTSGGKNVYTITFADGSTSDLNVYNGAKGDKGDTGAAGAKGDKGDTGAAGKDGLTTAITVGGYKVQPYKRHNNCTGFRCSEGRHACCSCFGTDSAI